MSHQPSPHTCHREIHVLYHDVRIHTIMSGICPACEPHLLDVRLLADVNGPNERLFTHHTGHVRHREGLVRHLLHKERTPHVPRAQAAVRGDCAVAAASVFGFTLHTPTTLSGSAPRDNERQGDFHPGGGIRRGGALHKARRGAMHRAPATVLSKPSFLIHENFLTAYCAHCGLMREDTRSGRPSKVIGIGLPSVPLPLKR